MRASVSVAYQIKNKLLNVLWRRHEILTSFHTVPFRLKISCLPNATPLKPVEGHPLPLNTF